MNLLAPENIIFLFMLSVIITNIFLVFFNAYIFREVFHLKVTLSYTIKTMKKLHPEIGTEADIQTLLNKSCKKE